MNIFGGFFFFFFGLPHLRKQGILLEAHPDFGNMAGPVGSGKCYRQGYSWIYFSISITLARACCKTEVQNVKTEALKSSRIWWLYSFVKKMSKTIGKGMAIKLEEQSFVKDNTASVSIRTHASIHLSCL